jgi:hypothetical protein
MRIRFAVMVATVWFLVGPAPQFIHGADIDTVVVSSARELQEALARSRRGLSVLLAPGEYQLSPTAGFDSTCGNCDAPERLVPMTYGVRVTGENVWIVGPELGEAVIRTHAGYGIYFEHCRQCGITGVKITGGARDTAQAATDAAVVAKHSTVSVIGNTIADNIGDSVVVARTVVGIMGVCGREGSLMRIEDNRIVRNSWDGVALYRDAEAEIECNLIDGVDRARGAEVGGGRGVGVGVTWNAKARINRNLVRRYWKGIGIFVDAGAAVEHNIVEEMLTWGIAYWDAGKGRPWAYIDGNVVYDCGACGVSITRETPFDSSSSPGGFVGNVVVKTGQNPKYDDPDYYCYQCALAVHAAPENFEIRDNLFFGNRRATENLPDHDVSGVEFERRLPRYLRDIVLEVPEWCREESAFLRAYAGQ